MGEKKTYHAYRDMTLARAEACAFSCINKRPFNCNIEFCDL